MYSANRLQIALQLSLISLRSYQYAVGVPWLFDGGLRWSLYSCSLWSFVMWRSFALPFSPPWSFDNPPTREKTQAKQITLIKIHSPSVCRRFSFSNLPLIFDIDKHFSRKYSSTKVNDTTPVKYLPVILGRWLWWGVSWIWVRHSRTSQWSREGLHSDPGENDWLWGSQCAQWATVQTRWCMRNPETVSACLQKLNAHTCIHRQ